MMKRTKSLMYFDFVKSINEFNKKSKEWNDIDEIKIHQCFCPFHHTTCHFFGAFRIKNIMFDDVLVPWVVLLL